MKLKQLSIFAVLLFSSFVFIDRASAAIVTIDEVNLDAVFSQASFGANTIDIRILPTIVIQAPSLLDITTNAEIGQLFNMFNNPRETSFAYFVDTISACGSTISQNIVGCGSVNGNDFVVESSFAASSFGAELHAHELGHNLGLGHRNGAGNLMHPALNNGTDLNAAEVATILGNQLVQTDGFGDLFIEIQPVLVAVPEPTAFAMFGIGLTGLIARRRRS